LLISGAPGAGKTTTIIKRLAQKKKPEFLLENGEIDTGELDTLRTTFNGATNWVLFISSELLRGYLREAVAQERLASRDRDQCSRLARVSSQDSARWKLSGLAHSMQKTFPRFFWMIP
jgi:adenylate kinase family enzyme